MMHMSPMGFNVLRSFEGRALRAYKDCVGVWTIGFGNTNADAAVLGFEIKAGVRITEQQAEDLLQVAMRDRYEAAVREALPGADQPTFDAGCDFSYNLGPANLKNRGWCVSWRAGKGAKQILEYDHGGGKVIAGLTRRRHRELDMIETGNYGPEGVTAPPIVATDGNVEIAPGKTVSKPIPFPNSTGMLWRGDGGPEVKDYQEALNANGFAVPVTGTFDDATEAATRAFQHAHPQLDEDGVGGPATRAALQRGVNVNSKAKRAIVVGTAGGAATAADHTSHATPFLPTWSITLLAIGFVAMVAFVAWQYRDEIKARFGGAS